MSMSKNVWKPTAREVELIKRAAAREGSMSLGRVLLEPGIRINLVDDSKNIDVPGGAYNIALITDDPDWNDTDLADFGSWVDFRKGVTLTEDGRAIVDFYIRKRFVHGWDDSLFGNVSVYYAGGRITRIHGYPGEYPVE